jgi:hypothetical protein
MRDGFDEAAPADAAKALHLQLGAASPLWLVFAGAAGVGMAYWWMSRWAQPVNLEAWFGATLDPASGPAPAPTEAAVAEIAKPPEPPVAKPPVVEPPAFVEVAPLIPLAADAKKAAVPAKPKAPPAPHA